MERINFRVALGKRITQLRTEKGWSIEKLAAESNVPAELLLKIEAGSENFYADTLESIMAALSIHFKDFYNRLFNPET